MSTTKDIANQQEADCLKNAYKAFKSKKVKLEVGDLVRLNMETSLFCFESPFYIEEGQPALVLELSPTHPDHEESFLKGSYKVKIVFFNRKTNNRSVGWYSASLFEPYDEPAHEQPKQDPGLDLIIAERQKQMRKYTAVYDDQHDDGSLVHAAESCLVRDPSEADVLWPKSWDREHYKKFRSKLHKQRITIAAALLAAELSRLERLENAD
jgi:hypothetical protein